MPHSVSNTFCLLKKKEAKAFLKPAGQCDVEFLSSGGECIFQSIQGNEER